MLASGWKVVAAEVDSFCYMVMLGEGGPLSL